VASATPTASTATTHRLKKGKVMSEPITKEQFLDYTGNLTLIQAAALVMDLEERFNVSAAAPVVVAGVAVVVEEEQTEFKVMLLNFGEKKINVIKAVRELTGLGLKEAKNLVESAPIEVKGDLTKDEASKMKDTLEKAGAKAELK